MTRRKTGCLFGMIGALGMLYVLLFVVSPIIGENHKRHGAHDVVSALLNQEGDLEDVVQRSGFSIAMNKASRQDVTLIADMNGWSLPGDADLSFHRLSLRSSF